MDLPVFSLSWELMLTIATGYAGYFVANVGMREHHKTVDVTFSTLVFGFFGTAGYVTVGGWTASIWAATPSAFFAAMIAGALWTIVGRKWLSITLRYLKVSNSDDFPKAFDSLVAEVGVNYTQLSVRLLDGSWLMCSDLRNFTSDPNGPCILSRSGDVLMYVTHTRGPKADDTWIERDDLRFEDWGIEISLIPQSQITRVDVRRRWQVPTSL